MKKKSIFLVILIIIVLLAEAVNIYYSNTVSIESMDVREIESEISSIREQNKDLQSQIFALTSFDVVASKAAEIGFVEADHYISLYDPLEVARR